MASYTIRACISSDAPTIARHRVEMFRDMGDVPTERAAAVFLEASIPAIRAELDRGAYFGWFAVNGEQVIAGVGAHVKATLPRMAADGIHVFSSAVPLVVNVYTEPNWRKRGVATALMRILMQWAQDQSFDRVVLHASNQARSLYESLGFVPSNEMRWRVA